MGGRVLVESSNRNTPEQYYRQLPSVQCMPLLIKQTFEFIVNMASLEVLSEGELNHIVSMLRTSPLEWVGNEEWTKQMSCLCSEASMNYES